MRLRLSRNILGLLALIIMLIVVPLFISEYYVDVLTLCLINAILVVGFRFVNLCGEVSFGHVALMGVGAYTTALITTRLGWPFWVSLPMAGLVSAFVAFVLSYPLLRMKGVYFFIGSFAAGEGLRLSWLKFKFFGGQAGIKSIPLPSLPGADFGDLTVYYYLTLAVTLLCLVVMYRLEHSRVGNIIKAIGAQDLLAESVGLNIRRYKTIAFVVGSAFAGIAGAVFAHRLTSIDPFQFIITLNLYVIVWAIFGGLGSFVGPLIGLATFSGVEEAVHRSGYLEQWLPLIYGVMLILVVLLMPKGLISLPEIVRRLKARSRLEIGDSS